MSRSEPEETVVGMGLKMEKDFPALWSIPGKATELLKSFCGSSKWLRVISMFWGWNTKDSVGKRMVYFHFNSWLYFIRIRGQRSLNPTFKLVFFFHLIGTTP